MLSGESAEITTEEEDLLARSKNEIKVHSGKQSMEDEKPSQTQEMSKMTEGPSYKDSLIGEAFLNPQDLEDYQKEEYISEDDEEEDDGEVDCLVIKLTVQGKKRIREPWR
jgi:hypothetical protein